ncbi:thioredoxin-disulfide reductase [Isosphaeraceae bacterium EP7]
MSHPSVIIIGSGSAGLTAALYTARANLAPIVFEGKEPGGQLTWTTIVENFPGFPDGINGPDLMEQMRKQAQRFGADTRFETVTKVDFSKRPFRVWATEDPKDENSAVVEYKADAVIIATGASARLLGLPSEWEFMGFGVSTCATCDAALYRNREVAVVGGGDTAAEEANFLTRFARKVTLIHRRDDLRASKIMRERVLANSKIELAWNTEVEEVLGAREPYKVVEGVRLKSTDDGSKRELKLDGLFLAIGHVPNTSAFEKQLAMNAEGYLFNRTSLAWKDAGGPADWHESFPEFGTSTSIEGVFACGDVVDTHYRQAITAAGSGCAAAIDCEKWLELQGE